MWGTVSSYRQLRALAWPGRERGPGRAFPDPALPEGRVGRIPQAEEPNAAHKDAEVSRGGRDSGSNSTINKAGSKNTNSCVPIVLLVSRKCFTQRKQLVFFFFFSNKKKLQISGAASLTAATAPSLLRRSAACSRRSTSSRRPATSLAHSICSTFQK